MKFAEEEELYRQVNQSSSPSQGQEDSVVFDVNNPKGYRRRAFFQDLNEIESLPSTPLLPVSQQQQPRYDRVIHLSHTQVLNSPPSEPVQETIPSTKMSLQHILQRQQSRHKEILSSLSDLFHLQRQRAKLVKVNSPKSYAKLIGSVVQEARKWALKKLPEDFQFSETKIPGTGLDTREKTRRFRLLMDEALNKGRWVYEPDRNYPDLGGAIAWSKKTKNEKDRDVAINRPPFPEAGKYHWEPTIDAKELNARARAKAMGWYAQRIQPQDFCRILGPRHIVLIGDLIHWQLHDSIMYNMFDTPQACYGDLACHLGVGHPLCPLPNDVRPKFVRNDLLSPIRPSKSKLNETKTQDPVEMSWLRDMKLKDTVILGATHQTMDDKTFRRRLTDTLIKIRKTRPDALIIYRNNPVGHPDCPSKANGFNSNKVRQNQEQQQPTDQITIKSKKSKEGNLEHNNSTFSAEAKPFENDIPVAEMLEYPLNWVHYDRQNRMAKEIVEATGGIYWNIATMTNMRPDGHVGGQDCLSYKRPGPTDEWAVSLYNLFKTIEMVENEF
ncbi:hypothetical protein BGX26_000696 [Mortierella sp. AD094]|nr:hypothetical protein BGX26_000696 [Mortierella sp. AD094]